MQNSGFQVHVLASGSKGNSTLIGCGNSCILIDAGISARRILTGMKELGYSPESCEGVFITHEHSDHVSGLAQLIKQTRLPVYTKGLTAKYLQQKHHIGEQNFIPLTKHIIDVGKFTVEAFKVSHDALEPIGISCYNGANKATLLTDTGLVDEFMLGHMDESTMLVLEANHDPYLLQWGPYPPILKQRVAGPQGHLSNEVAAQALLMIKRPPDLQVVLAHRSEKNNTVPKVEDTLGKVLHGGGLRIGVDVHLYHGQPKECISLFEGKV